MQKIKRHLDNFVVCLYKTIEKGNIKATFCTEKKGHYKAIYIPVYIPVTNMAYISEQSLASSRIASLIRSYYL